MGSFEAIVDIGVFSMPLPIVKIHFLDKLYSPFSGLPVESDDGVNENDKTLLFVYYGDFPGFAYINERLTEVSGDIENLDIESLNQMLTIDGGFILEVDTDWNGINYYGFAPITD